MFFLKQQKDISFKVLFFLTTTVFLFILFYIKWNHFVVTENDYSAYLNYEPNIIDIPQAEKTRNIQTCKSCFSAHSQIVNNETKQGLFFSSQSPIVFLRFLDFKFPLQFSLRSAGIIHLAVKLLAGFLSPKLALFSVHIFLFLMLTLSFFFLMRSFMSGSEMFWTFAVLSMSAPFYFITAFFPPVALLYAGFFVTFYFYWKNRFSDKIWQGNLSFLVSIFLKFNFAFVFIPIYVLVFQAFRKNFFKVLSFQIGLTLLYFFLIYSAPSYDREILLRLQESQKDVYQFFIALSEFSFVNMLSPVGINNLLGWFFSYNEYYYNSTFAFGSAWRAIGLIDILTGVGVIASLRIKKAFNIFIISFVCFLITFTLARTLSQYSHLLYVFAFSASACLAIGIHHLCKLCPQGWKFYFKAFISFLLILRMGLFLNELSSSRVLPFLDEQTYLDIVKDISQFEKPVNVFYTNDFQPGCLEFFSNQKIWPFHFSWYTEPHRMFKIMFEKFDSGIFLIIDYPENILSLNSQSSKSGVRLKLLKEYRNAAKEKLQLFSFERI